MHAMNPAGSCSPGWLCALILWIGLGNGFLPAEDLWLDFQGGEGPGKGKHIVLLSGDEEYRSEEGLPQLGKILARRHGFRCTVLFSIHPQSGRIDPNHGSNIPGLEVLSSADLVVVLLRFRDLPDDQMRPIDKYLNTGKPVIGLRTATHAFLIPEGKTYSRYSNNSKQEGWVGGFGPRILGEKWVNHHGLHAKESTRGVIAPGEEKHPIVQGCEDIWGPSDVYTVRLPLPGDCRPLILGQVLEGMQPGDKPVPGPKNNPLLPVAWTKTYSGAHGETGRVFTTTMGAANDLLSEGLRRLIVNAAYWCLGMEDKIPARANVDLVGDYRPSNFGFGTFRQGLKPSDFAIK
jgi:hypothetical protein